MNKNCRRYQRRQRSYHRYAAEKVRREKRWLVEEKNREKRAVALGLVRET